MPVENTVGYRKSLQEFSEYAFSFLHNPFSLRKAG